MLSESIYQELHFLLHSFALGIVITFVYDNIRVCRRVISHNTAFISMEDLIFWVWAALAIFLLQNRENNGVFRWFSVVGAFLGMLTYRKTLSNFYVKNMTFLLRKILKFLYIFFSGLFSPIYFLERKTMGIVKKMGRRMKQRATLQKIRLTSYKKMIKITLCKRKEGRRHEQKSHST